MESGTLHTPLRIVQWGYKVELLPSQMNEQEVSFWPVIKLFTNQSQFHGFPQIHSHTLILTVMCVEMLHRCKGEQRCNTSRLRTQLSKVQYSKEIIEFDRLNLN